MPLKIPDNELKLLMACDRLVRKKSLSFALGIADSGVLLLARPRNKDPKAAQVRAAYKKTLKAMKCSGKLVTWGEARWEDGRVLLDGEKAFPSGAARKIRELAVDQKLKSFVKVTCASAEGSAEDEDAEETTAEAAAAEAAALQALEAAAPPIVEDNDQLEALIDELLQEERAELAAEITALNEAVAAAIPAAAAGRRIAEKLAQIRAFGAPDGLLPATLAVYTDLCASLLAEMPGEHTDRAEVAALLKEARATAAQTGAALTVAQEAAWSKMQAAVHYTTMQLPALLAVLRGSKDEQLREIGSSNDIPSALGFLHPFTEALRALGAASDADQAQAALGALDSGIRMHAAAVGTERFQVLDTANPFPVPMPLRSLGEQAQTLRDTF